MPGIKQEFKRAKSPQFNGVAECAPGLIVMATVAGRIQSSQVFPRTQLPTTVSLSCANAALNRNATAASLERKSPYNIHPPPSGSMAPFSKARLL